MAVRPSEPNLDEGYVGQGANGIVDVRTERSGAQSNAEAVYGGEAASGYGKNGHGFEGVANLSYGGYQMS